MDIATNTLSLQALRDVGKIIGVTVVMLYVTVFVLYVTVIVLYVATRFFFLGLGLSLALYFLLFPTVTGGCDDRHPFLFACDSHYGGCVDRCTLRTWATHLFSLWAFGSSWAFFFSFIFYAFLLHLYPLFLPFLK